MNNQPFTLSHEFDSQNAGQFFFNDPAFSGFANGRTTEFGLHPDFTRATFETGENETVFFSVPFMDDEGESPFRAVGVCRRFSGRFMVTSISEVRKGGFSADFSRRFFEFAAA